MNLKKIEVTFIDNTIRRYKNVIDDTMEKKDTFIRFKNDKGESIYINVDKILMFSMTDQ